MAINIDKIKEQLSKKINNNGNSSVFDDAEINNLTSFSPTQSVDFSALPSEYAEKYGNQEQYERLNRQRELEATRDDIYSGREQLLSNISRRGLGLGVKSEQEMQPFEERAASVLSEKEIKGIYENNLKKNLRMQELRQNIAQKQINDISRSFSLEMNNFMREYSKLKQNVANKMIDEQRAAKFDLQRRYERSVEEIEKTLLEQKTGGTWARTIGGVVGGGIGLIASGGNPMAMMAGYNIGGNLAGGGYGVMTNNRYANDLRNSIYL